MEYWCKVLKRSDKLIIIHIGDTISLDEKNDAIDWENTNALPSILKPHIKRIPLYIDCLLNPTDFQIQNNFLQVLQKFHPYLKLQGHQKTILGITFSKDENHVLTYSQDGTAKIWDLSKPREPSHIDLVTDQLYQKHPVMMRQPLGEEMKNKYGLDGLYMERIRK